MPSLSRRRAAALPRSRGAPPLTRPRAARTALQLQPLATPRVGATARQSTAVDQPLEGGDPAPGPPRLPELAALRLRLDAIGAADRGGRLLATPHLPAPIQSPGPAPAP